MRGAAGREAGGDQTCAPHPNPSPAGGEGLSSTPISTPFCKHMICAPRSTFAGMTGKPLISNDEVMKDQHPATQQPPAKAPQDHRALPAGILELW